MENKIISHILSSKNLESVSQENKQKFKIELSQYFNDISIVAKDLGINIEELWKIYIAKREFNKLDTREKRHVMYLTQEEKINQLENNKIELQKKYKHQSLQIKINGYDITTQTIREINQEKEFALAIFQNEENIKVLADMVPPYIKYKILKCSNIYIVNIPIQCITKFTDLCVLLIPNKVTVIIGINGYSPNVEIVTMYTLGELRIGFINSDTAEKTDEEHPNKFWFFENYNPKRKYHYIYSNSRKIINSN